MKIAAYILAADPAWIESSLGSYYDLVGRIIVSYDESGLGWTGAPIDVEQCLRRLRAIDKNKKMVFIPGNFNDSNRSPMENDTRQRQTAFDIASEGVDWVLQLDTDEVLPQPTSLTPWLQRAQSEGFYAVEWPMRVLFQRTLDGRFLEVCAKTGNDRFEYPGPIAVRPGARFCDARRITGSFLRLTIRGDDHSPQLARQEGNRETRWDCLNPKDAIVHNSWARDAKSIRSKIASWGHNQGLKSWLFYYLHWRPAPLIWRYMRNFHPLFPNLWPALKPSLSVPCHH